MQKLITFLSDYLDCSENNLYDNLIYEYIAHNNYFPLFFLDTEKLFYKNCEVILDHTNGIEIIDNVFIYYLCYRKTNQIEWESPYFVELSQLLIQKAKDF